MVSSVLFVSLLIVGCGGGGGDNNNNNGSEVKFKTIIAGGFHSLALSNNGKVYATGRNDHGQLGLGDTTYRNAFTDVSSLNDKNITALFAGYFHSFALSNDGKAYAAGENAYGKLGFSDAVDRNAFTEVTDLSNKNITAIFAGDYHSLALSNDGKVYATGYNNYGQLGLGNDTNKTSFTEVTSLSGKNIIALSAGGGWHSIALSKDGKVYATGYNSFGQLGLGNNDNKNVFTDVTSLSGKTIIAISAGAFYSLALTNDGKVYATGYNSEGQLGLGDNDNKNTFTEVSSLSGITSISAGEEHSLALSNDGKVYATGLNDEGQLGLGDNDNKNVFTEVTSLSGITSISAGSSHSIALSSDRKIYTTGWNDYGQLGLGDKTDRNTFTKVTVWND